MDDRTFIKKLLQHVTDSVCVDLDRVHRQLLASHSLVEVSPEGLGQGPYKEYPWGHMAPFVTTLEFCCSSYYGAQ